MASCHTVAKTAHALAFIASNDTVNDPCPYSHLAWQIPTDLTGTGVIIRFMNDVCTLICTRPINPHVHFLLLTVANYSQCKYRYLLFNQYSKSSKLTAKMWLQCTPICNFTHWQTTVYASKCSNNHIRWILQYTLPMSVRASLTLAKSSSSSMLSTVGLPPWLV